MKNIEIKKIFLHAMLSIIHNEMVLDKSIEELKLPLKNNGLFYEKILKLIDNKVIDIDILINSLISNNIGSINKTLQFND